MDMTEQHSHSPHEARSTFGYDHEEHDSAPRVPPATNAIATAVAVPAVASTAVQLPLATISTAPAPDITDRNSPTTMTLSVNQPIPLSAYISLSQVAISSALKVAMISTSLSLGLARTVVSGIDKVLGVAVKSAVGQNDEGSRGLSPAFVASLPFRAALLGINFSDILVQTILETVDGSVNLALTTVQDGLDLMDTLFGPDSTSQTGETFREVWAILSREFTTTAEDEGGVKGGYPALEGMRLFMAYVAIQFATSEQWETIRVRTQGRLVGECLESKDEELGSSTAWSATGAWPAEWTHQGFGGMTDDELLQEKRWLELREQREGRCAASFSSTSSGSPNPELTNFLAASYRFSRFCSAMYGSLFLEVMGAPERYPPHVPMESASSASGTPVPATAASSTERSRSAATANNADDHHFHHYTGTPLGSILYSSDTAATIQDGFYSPRYYLLDDVETKQIVLVLRGTKSLHDLMIDLTCDGADLWLNHDTTPLRDAHGNIVVEERLVEVEVSYGPGVNHNDDDSRSNSSKGATSRMRRPYRVHTGFLKAARTIASAETIGIQEKVKAALESRPGYSLLLIGHSLGAGIASVLSMLWADPATGLTPEMPSHSVGSRSSGNLGTRGSMGDFYLPGYLPFNNANPFLPPGRRVRCYAYGSPKVMCPRLSKRAIKLVTSISYGDDVVGRLSLGSVRNIGHAMRALLAMRPAPPPSPPASASPSPPSSPTMDPSSTEVEVELLHDSSETLEDLLEQEGEGVDHSEHRQQEASTDRRRRERREEKSKDKPTQQSIGLEIVQKVIRWRLTKEEHLFDEFMDIRRAMHREMEKYQDRYDGGDFYTDDQESMMQGLDMSRVTPALVPAGKVLWIRPTTLEKELENQETKEHPFESVLHQFEWDHPLGRDPASLLVPAPISQHLQSYIQDDTSDSASMRTFKSTVRSGLFSAPVSSSTLPSQTHSPAATSSLPSAEATLPIVGENHLQAPALNRRTSLETVATFASGVSATTTSPTSLHPGSQNTEKLLYRMYAVPQPENVFDEMLFSRRMWSDHLPLTYEFILAGKHAIPVTNTGSFT
ncbi:hypothetical protein EC968_001894 [Mortierella alpina]|nr:hypothetical protein EC968_001894 [Mortierella alpina]